MNKIAPIIMGLALCPQVQAHHAEPSYFTPQSTIEDVLNQPAFAGFAERLLPWDNRLPQRSMTLSQVVQLMPYHSHIYPNEIVATLNDMVKRHQHGETLFYDIYTPQEKQQDPSKRHTGIFFLRGKANAPFAMIAAGGGFAYVGSLHEGLPLAQKIAEQGYNAFVVKYRAGMGEQVATRDLARAIAFVREHAKTLRIHPDGYSLWGASAGARMVANIGSHGTQAFGESANSRPSSVIMQYTGHRHVAKQEVPTFAVVGEHDGIASPAVMRQRIQSIAQQGVATQFQVYPDLEHGFALGTGTSAQGWEQAAIRFWLENR